MAKTVTDRIERAKSYPEWMKWMLGALTGAITGAIGTAITIGIMIGTSQARLAGAEAHVMENREASERNRDDITEIRAKDLPELKTQIESADTRAEERHRATMQMLAQIQSQLDRQE